MADPPVQSAHKGRHRVDVRLVQLHPLKPDARLADRVRRFTLDDFNPARILGRASRNRSLNPAATNLWIESPIVTKEHARFTRGSSVNEPLFIRDLNSTHGTFVAGTKITTDCAVADGDIVQFGDRISNGPILFEPPSFLVEYDVHPSGRPPTPLSSSPVSAMPRDNSNTFQVPEPDSDFEVDYEDLQVSKKEERSYSCPEYESDLDSNSEPEEQSRGSLGPHRHITFDSDYPHSEGEDETSSNNEDDEGLELTGTVVHPSSLPTRAVYLPEEPAHQRSHRQFSSSRSSSIDSEDMENVWPGRTQRPAAPKPGHSSSHIPSAIPHQPDLGSSPKHPIVVDGGDSKPQSSERDQGSSPVKSSTESSQAYRPCSPDMAASYDPHMVGDRCDYSGNSDSDNLGREGLVSPSVLSHQAQAGTPRPSSPSDAAMVKSASQWCTFPPRAAETRQPNSDYWTTDVQAPSVPLVDPISTSAESTEPANVSLQRLLRASYERMQSNYLDGPFTAAELVQSKPSRSSLPIEELINPPSATPSRKRTAEIARLDADDVPNEFGTDILASPTQRQPSLHKASRLYESYNIDRTFSEPVAVKEPEEATFNLDDIFTEDEVDEDDLDEDNLSDDLNVNDFGFSDMFDARNDNSDSPSVDHSLHNNKPASVPGTQSNMISPLNAALAHVDAQHSALTMTNKSIIAGGIVPDISSKQDPEAVVEKADVLSPIEIAIDAPSPAKKVKLWHAREHRSPRFSRFMSKAVPFMAGAAATAATIFAGAGMLISTMHDELRQEAMLDLGFANV